MAICPMDSTKFALQSRSLELEQMPPQEVKKGEGTPLFAMPTTHRKDGVYFMWQSGRLKAAQPTPPPSRK